MKKLKSSFELLVANKNILLLIMLVVSFTVFADDEWDRVRFRGLPYDKTYEINVGTGFYINNDTIITGGHVVSDCINIAIRGAVKPQEARIHHIDKELDLAILKSAPAIIKPPFITSNYNVIKTGDILFSIGYPTEYNQNGEYVIKEAKVINVFQDTKTNFSKIEFTDNVSYGNSGGPLLDRNSNLIGIVTAKHRYYNLNNPRVVTRTHAAAIGIDGLLDLLKKNNIPFFTVPSYDMFTNFAVDNLTKHYVVNIHCIRAPL